MDAAALADAPDDAPLRQRLEWRVLLSLAIGLALLACSIRGTVVDRQLFHALNALALPWMLPASWLSVLGTGVAAVVLAAATGPRTPRPAAALLLTVILGGLAVQALKLWIDQPRPLGALGAQEVQVVGISLYTRAFPSGHAAMLAGVAALAWCWPGRRQGRPDGWLLPGLLSLLALAGALARVIVGAHWPSDVLAGAAVGLLLGTLFALHPGPRWLIESLSSVMTSKAGSRVVGSVLMVLAGFVWVAHVDYPQARGLQALLAALALWSGARWWLHHPGPWSPRSFRVLSVSRWAREPAT